MFQCTLFASHTYVFSMRYLCRWVSPFGNLRIKANLPAPRSLSQAITSFVAYHCQGIHHVLLFTWPYNFDVSAWVLNELFRNYIVIFKECLIGLSPIALCRKWRHHSYKLSPTSTIRLTYFRISNKVWYSFWRNQKLLPTTTQGTVCTKPLRMCSFLTQPKLCSLKLATLIKLYKLLKNSRLIK